MVSSQSGTPLPSGLIIIISSVRLLQSIRHGVACRLFIHLERSCHHSGYESIFSSQISQYLLLVYRLSSLPLRQFTELAVTTSSGKEFHILTTLYPKKFARIRLLQSRFYSFKLCPRHWVSPLENGDSDPVDLVTDVDLDKVRADGGIRPADPCMRAVRRGHGTGVTQRLRNLHDGVGCTTKRSSASGRMP